MAETGEETYYIVGESRTNVDNAITKVYGSFFIAFEVIPSTGEIIQTDCSRTLELTNDFIRKLFLHKHLETDAKVIEEAMITAICVAAGFILSKILLGGML